LAKPLWSRIKHATSQLSATLSSTANVALALHAILKEAAALDARQPLGGLDHLGLPPAYYGTAGGAVRDIGSPEVEGMPVGSCLVSHC
jgi:hypothetical protein